MSDMAVFEGNIVLTGGDLTILNDAAAIQQQVLFRLRTFQAEWFRDRGLGVDYPRLVDKRFSASLAEQLIRSALIPTPGVTSVTSVSVDVDKLQQTAKIKVAYRDIFSTSPVTVETSI